MVTLRSQNRLRVDSCDSRPSRAEAGRATSRPASQPASQPPSQPAVSRLQGHQGTPISRSTVVTLPSSAHCPDWTLQAHYYLVLSDIVKIFAVKRLFAERNVVIARCPQPAVPSRDNVIPSDEMPIATTAAASPDARYTAKSTTAPCPCSMLQAPGSGDLCISARCTRRRQVAAGSEI